MRLLVLNVDRDNDLGRKTGIQGPVIGRQAVLEAATALALADPEEADANGMFAAVKEHDEIARDLESYGAEAVFVAAATGHIREGTQADAVISHQVDQILTASKADHVILVSDGAEDEHLMPIIQTRLKVDGVRRVVIKQAKSLEGALALFNRLLSDEKLQRRFGLPLAVLAVAGAFAFLFQRPEIVVAALLFIGASYVFVQVFKGKEPVKNFFTRLSSELRAGKLSFASSVIALVVVVWSGFTVLSQISDRERQGLIPNDTVYSITFLELIFWWLALAVVIVIAGRALDELVRERRIRSGYWQALFHAVGLAVLLNALVGAAHDRWIEARPIPDLATAETATELFLAGFLFLVGLIVQRYYTLLNGRVAAAAAQSR